MSIQHYTDIPNLYACWHGTLSTTTVDGSDNVQTVEPAYPGLPLDQNLVFSKTETGDNIKYGISTIGSMPAWDTQNTQAQGSVLACQGISKSFTSGFTVVVATQLTSQSVNEMWSINRATMFEPGIDGAGSGYAYRQRTGWGDITTTAITNLTPTVQVYTQPAAGGPVLRVWDDVNNGEEHGLANPSASPTDVVALACAGVLRPDLSVGTYGLHGKCSLFAVYESVLDSNQITDVLELTQHWIANNSIPSTPVYDTSTQFGPVTCNDPGATLTWQWSDDNEQTWQDALTVLSNATLEPALPAGTTQLNIDSGLVSDSGKIRCLATTPYDSVGKPTQADTLIVVVAEEPAL